MRAVKTPTPLWLTRDLLAWADALIAAMAMDPEVWALGMATRTAVLRLAIARGLWGLERQYQPPAPTPLPHLISNPTDSPRRPREHAPLLARAIHDSRGLGVKESAIQEGP
jgi:hypothetical protein